MIRPRGWDYTVECVIYAEFGSKTDSDVEFHGLPLSFSVCGSYHFWTDVKRE